VALLAVSVTVASAQHDLRFNRLSIADGLSENGVSCILQDRRGFIWFGTLDGLNRYDGYEFRVYRHEPFNSRTISLNRINCLIEDSSGNLWVGTSGGGLNRLVSGSRDFARFSIGNDYVLSLATDKDGTLWAGTLGGLFRSDSTGGSFERVALPGSDTVQALHLDEHGILWIGTPASLIAFDPARKCVGRVQNLRKLTGLPALGIRKIAEDERGRLWIGTERSGILLVDPTTERSIRLGAGSPSSPGLSADDIWDIAIGGAGFNRGIWVATASGLFWSPGEQQGKISFEAIRTSLHDPSSLSGDEVWSLLVDREGILWIGTWQDGVSIRAPYRYKFDHLTLRIGNERSLSSANVNALWEDRRGDLWVGTLRSGIDQVDGTTGGVTHLRALPPSPGDPSGWYHRCVTAFAEDSLRGMWVASWAGLFLLNQEGNVLRRYTWEANNPRGIATNLLNTIFLDRQGRLWIGTRGVGLDMLDTRREEAGFRHYRHKKGDSRSLPSDMVWVIDEGPDGRIWVGTDDGLSSLLPSRGEFTSFMNRPDDTTSLCDNTIHSLWIQDEQTVWIGTSAGLEKLNFRERRFRHFNERDGLPNAYIYGILPDSEGNLWLSTNKGLARFRESALLPSKSRNYTNLDGLQGLEFCIGAAHRGRSGKLYFGGLNGYNAFFPSAIVDNPHRPLVVLKQITHGNTTIPLEARSDSEGPIVLPYPLQDFTVDFLILEYTAPSRNQYQFKLEGYDATWTRGTGRRQARYTNIAPGEYTFLVRGANADGVWSNQEASLKMVLLPPYWATFWFRGLVVVLLSALLFGFYKLRTARLLAVERMRVRIASDLHDDIGSTLTNIAVNSEVIQGTDDPDRIREASQKIGTASREIITTLSDIVWSIDARHDTVGNLLDRMRDFAGEILSVGNIEYTFVANGLDPEATLPAELRQNLYLIFKEALTNVTRHSTARHVAIQILNGQARFVMQIANDGVPRDAQEKSSGHHGLKNMQMRAERIQATLRISGPKSKLLP
jgi:ligand-binding sensor domain-containing protein